MSNILLAGCTTWLREEDLKTAFPDDTCILIGDPEKKGLKSVRTVDRKDLSDRTSVRALLHTWEFDEILFFSESTSLFGDTTFEELKFLADLLEEAGTLSSPKVFLFFGNNRQHIGSPLEDRLLSRTVESLRKSCLQEDIDCVFLKIPWIYYLSENGADPALRTWISSAAGRPELNFPVPEMQEISFISADDLALFIYRLRDRYSAAAERDITLGIPITARDLGDAIEEVLPDCTCRYADQHSALAIPKEDGFVRTSYSWFQQHNIVQDLRELWSRYHNKAEEEKTGKDFFAAITKAKPLRIIRITAELIIGFLIMEGLLRINDVQVQFQLIDFRLLYILIFGLMYNIPVGLCAAFLSSLSLFLAYSSQGVSGLTLFYEPTNWFVFIIYFTLGAVCGYVRSKDREDLAFAAAEAELLREKYHFLRELFLEAQQEKQEYRQQIISSQDSFGKIFRITQQLDVISPHLIFMHAMSVVEEIMENRTVTIYSVGRNKAFARLEAASRGMDAPRSLSLDSCREILDGILEDGIWTNRELKNHLPMYACGVVRDGQVVLLVMIWKAEFGQMTLYFSNLLKILTGLISTSLLRSYDYQNATHEKRYYGDTIMLKEDAFLESIETAFSMNQAKIASYSLHRLDSGSLTPEEISRALASRIRENDALGLVNGSLYLLISQSTAEGVSILRERFAAMDIHMHEADFEETIAALAPPEAEESHE